MHALIGSELSRGRSTELIELARRGRYVPRRRRRPTRRPAPAIGAE